MRAYNNETGKIGIHKASHEKEAEKNPAITGRNNSHVKNNAPNPDLQPTKPAEQSLYCSGRGGNTIRPIVSQNSILQLQRIHGNRHVNRILHTEAVKDNESSITQDIEHIIEGTRGGGQALDNGVKNNIGKAMNADFSGVRVHTDSQADGLNRSLKARAFTTGKDIYFRQGEYNPGSSSGRELLAHELTHVVQQGEGGTVRSRKEEGNNEATCHEYTATHNAGTLQAKLTIGTPDDVYEQEADHASKAYKNWEQRAVVNDKGNTQVRCREANGEKKDVALLFTDNSSRVSRSSSLSSEIRRDDVEDLRDFAELGEQEQQEEMERQPPPIMQVNNIADANSARGLMHEIEGYRPQMQNGGRTGTVSGSQISANERAIAKLSDYLVQIGEQGRTLSTFQQQARQVRLDFGRVSGQMVHFEAMGIVDAGQTAAFRAEQIVGAATGAGSTEESAAGMRGNAEVIRPQIQEFHNALVTAGGDVNRAQRASSIAVRNLNIALSNLNAGIIPREEDPELASRQRAIKAKVSQMQSRLATGLQVLSALGGAAGLNTAATTAATQTFGETTTSLGRQALSGLTPASIAAAISQEWYREETNEIESQIAQANAQSREAAITANVAQTRSAQTVLFDALQTLEQKMTEYQQARDTLRTQLDNLGVAADRESGGQGYRIIAGLLGDVDVLSVQIDTTIGLGETEEDAAQHATASREQLEGTRNQETGRREGSMTYFSPYQVFQLANFGRSGGLVYHARENRIWFVTPERTPGSAYGGRGAANPVIRNTMEDLQVMRETVRSMRDVLSRSLGMNMQR